MSATIMNVNWQDKELKFSRIFCSVIFTKTAKPHKSVQVWKIMIAVLKPRL